MQVVKSSATSSKLPCCIRITESIHCGLCRFVCEDKVKPHNMGLWIRRSLGKSQEMTAVRSEDSESIEKEWQHLMIEDKQERLQRAKHFRETGSVSA